MDGPSGNLPSKQVVMTDDGWGGDRIYEEFI